MKSCIDQNAATLMQQVAEIMTARGHRTRFPQTEAHKKFMNSYLAKTRQLAEAHPYLDLSAEMEHFSSPPADQHNQ